MIVLRRTIQTAIGGIGPLTVLLAGAAVWTAACGGGASTDRLSDSAGALIGREPVPAVHLLENHSSSLVVWRRAQVRERIVVHIDGHSDFDWLPDGTVARIAAASPDELAGLELHPYTLDGSTLSRFGIWNWLYPAARLGLVREMVWVVPDGTLGDREAQAVLVRDLVIDKIQGISLDEARALRPEGRRIRGTLLGLPITICELADLPAFDEPVLLDIDLDYFTTRSAATLEVAETPCIAPTAVLTRLEEKKIRADIATLSHSSLGGYLPARDRWLGRWLRDSLRSPGRSDDGWIADWSAIQDDLRSGEASGAVSKARVLAERRPEDPYAWYALYEALHAAGSSSEAREARRRAVALDPVLDHDDLIAGDRLWLNHDYASALDFYHRFLEKNPTGPFAAYVYRRIGHCLVGLDRDDEALPMFRRVVEMSPEHADTRLDLGLLLRQRGEMDAAVQELQLARKILPDRALYAMALGTTYLMAGRFEESVAELRAAVARQPCLARAHGALSAALFDLGRFDEAADHLKIALSIEPANPQFRAMVARLGQRGVPVSRVSSAP
jgi:tetratricopeptide (TPR) repeat protein